MRPHRLAPLILAAALVAAASGAWAQNAQATNEGTAFAQSLQGQLTATATAPNTAVVPGPTGDTGSLENYYSNPAAMQSAGQAAMAGNDAFLVSSAATANRATSSVTNNDAWLQSSFNIANNPQSQVDTSGNGSPVCTTSQQPRTTTTTSTYTCEAGIPVSQSEGVCTLQLKVDTSSTWDYACTNRYNQETRRFEISPACSALSASPTCALTGQGCTGPAAPYFQARQCIQGTQWTSSDQTCTNTRVVAVDTNYEYSCASTYDQAGRVWVVSSQCQALAAAAPNCAQTGQSCVSGAAPYSIGMSCTAGTQWGIGTRTCDPVRVITVNTQYVYNADRVWNGSAYAPDAASNALQGSGVCQVQATTCTGSSGNPATYSCQTGYQASTTQTQCVTTMGPSWDLAANVTPNGTLKDQGYVYGYTAVIRAYTNSTSTTANPTLEAAAQARAEAAFGGNCKITGGYSRALDSGKAYIQWALGSTPNLICKTLLPASITIAYTIDSGQFLNSNPTHSTLTNKTTGVGFSTYTKPYYAPNPCATVSNSCTIAGTTNDLNRNVTCTSQTPYAGCSPPVGMSQQSETCIATNAQGACTGWARTYVDPTGGCTKWTDQYLCASAVPAAGSPVSTVKSVSNDYWSGACQAITTDPTCSLTSSAVTEGQGTRVIDGLAVDRPSWATHETYTCAAASPVDTCTGQTGGCTQTARSCAGTDATGACSLWTYSYSCPADDGSGGCSVKSTSYLCQDPVAAAGAPTGTPKSVVSETWTGCEALSTNPACELKSEIGGGAETRVVDGLPVTRDPWSKATTYACWASNPIDGCTGQTTGCTQSGRTCQSSDRFGNCSAWTYSYSCPADDGSGNCAGQSQTYTCSAEVAAANPAQQVHTSVDRMYWAPVVGECTYATNPTCTSDSEGCIDTSPQTRVVNGVPVTAQCWMKSVHYMCEAPTGPATSNCQPAAGCRLDHTECLDDNRLADGTCAHTEQVYSCSTTSTTMETVSTCSASMCVGANCFTVAGSEDSGGLGQVYAALSIAKAGGQDYASSANLRIMGGQALRCRKSVLGFQNCCKDSGWGVDLGLAQCDESEKKLIQLQTAKACHYVGTFCSNKSFFGTCLTKSMQYCCFEGPLARIVNEAGRPQVNKTWGTAKNPSCEGFTVEQFQLLDLSQVDFSDFYAETMSRLDPPGATSTSSRIGQTLQQMYAGSQATTLTPEAP